MNSDMLISIAIPAYKAAYLRDAIKSVLQQTYKNFELIIVNDKSPEDISSIVNEFEDSRIKYYINEENIGGNDPVANWNKCLSYATGEFFALLCDDDLYESTFIEEMLALAQKYPQTNVFRARCKIIDSHGNIQEVYPSSPEYEPMENYMLDKEGGYRRQTISEFLYRREHIVKVGGYYPLPKAWCADDASCFRFSKEGGIVSSLKLLVSFRMSGINISSSDKDIIEKIRAEKLLTDYIKLLLNNNGIGIKDLILKARERLYSKKMASYLSDASWKDFIYLYKNRNNVNFNIRQRCFAKAILFKLINIAKRNE